MKNFQQTPKQKRLNFSSNKAKFKMANKPTQPKQTNDRKLYEYRNMYFSFPFWF